MRNSILVLCLCFTLNLSAQSDSKLTAIFPKAYGTWIYSDSIRIFNPENLYDYIDGGADSYLSYNFKELSVITYNKSDNKYITIEVYNHQSPLLAFGIYAQERPTKGYFLKIGAQGYQEEGILNFLCGKYYVKISSHDESAETGELIRKIALDLASKLDSKAEMPEILKYLPDEDKVANSESLLNTNFLGYDFFSATLLSTYKIGENTFKLFIIPCISNEKSSQIMTKYMQAVKMKFEGKEGIYEVNDPHNGVLILEWRGKFIWGVLNPDHVKLSTDYLTLIRDKVGKE